MEYVVATVGKIQLFNPATRDLMVTSKSLTEQSMSFAVTAEELRGGEGNKLLGKFYHDSAFNVKLTDQLINLEYLALNCGGSITAGSDGLVEEQITITQANTIVLPRSAKTFNGGLVMWYKKATEMTEHYDVVSMTDATHATVEGLAVGDVVCVKYFTSDEASRKFVVSANFIPSVVYAVMTLPIYRAGTTSESYSASSKIGELQVVIPQLQLDGNQEFSLTSSGVASASLNGSALATYTDGASCENNGYYAIITERIYGRSAVDNLSGIAVRNSDIDLASGETAHLTILGLYNDGTVPSVIDNSLLTFTSATEATATVSNEGVVTAVADGESVIEVVVTEKPALSANAVVTVA